MGPKFTTTRSRVTYSTHPPVEPAIINIIIFSLSEKSTFWVFTESVLLLLFLWVFGHILLFVHVLRFFYSILGEVCALESLDSVIFLWRILIFFLTVKLLAAYLFLVKAWFYVLLEWISFGFALNPRVTLLIQGYNPNSENVALWRFLWTLHRSCSPSCFNW